MPYWAPDELIHEDSRDGSRCERLYVEEALKIDDGSGTVRRHPFQPDIEDTGGQWVFGEKAWTPDTARLFDVWLAELCELARQFNRALYRLRKLRLEAEHHGTMDPLPDDPGTISAGQAEGMYIAAVESLSRHLDRKVTPGTSRVADMVQINGYVVSVRVVDGVVLEDGTSTGAPVRVMQPGGSDSSHIYLSSPFCSRC